MKKMQLVALQQLRAVCTCLERRLRLHHSSDSQPPRHLGGSSQPPRHRPRQWTAQ